MDMLTAVNRILAAVGEHPITSLESRNPTVQIVLQSIASACHDVQLRQLWFNTYETTLYPDQDGQVQLPHNTIAWKWYDHPSYPNNQYLVDSENMTTDWRIKGVESVEGKLSIELPYAELPPVVQHLVMCRALTQAFINDFGFEEIVQVFQRGEVLAEGRVIDQHLQHQRYSTTRSPRYQRIARHTRR